MGKETTSIRLKKAMEEQGLRQVDLLEKCKPYCELFDVKLSKSHLSHYLSGNFLPKQDKLTVLACALGVSEAWLMGYDVDKNEPQIKPSRLEVYAQLLNEEGMQKVEDYMNDLLESSRYRR